MLPHPSTPRSDSLGRGVHVDRLDTTRVAALHVPRVILFGGSVLPIIVRVLYLGLFREPALGGVVHGDVESVLAHGRGRWQSLIY